MFAALLRVTGLHPRAGAAGARLLRCLALGAVGLQAGLTGGMQYYTSRTGGEDYVANVSALLWLAGIAWALVAARGVRRLERLLASCGAAAAAAAAARGGRAAVAAIAICVAVYATNAGLVVTMRRDAEASLPAWLLAVYLGNSPFALVALATCLTVHVTVLCVHVAEARVAARGIGTLHGAMGAPADADVQPSGAASSSAAAASAPAAAVVAATAERARRRRVGGTYSRQISRCGVRCSRSAGCARGCAAHVSRRTGWS